MRIFGPEFQEVGHCGGQFIVTVSTAEDGRRRFNVGVRHVRPTPASWFGIYALPQGIPAGMMALAGVGSADPAQFSGCFPVLIASDTQGMFGHECPACKGYWRSRAAPHAWPMTCPYCGSRAETHAFLTKGQRRFVAECCRLIEEAMCSDKDGQSIIDMDQVSDEVSKNAERPPFFYAEESQQNLFTCPECRAANDILGRYGYCSCCGTRNDLQELEQEIKKARAKAAKGEDLGACVKDIVSAFDQTARQYSKELAKRVPMVKSRRDHLERVLYHNLKARANELSSWFAIELFQNFKDGDEALAILMFYRRHVYEHNGGEVDERYLRESGDTTVRLKQALRETPERVQKLADLVLEMGRRIHSGFHDLFPLEKKAVRMKP